MRILVLTLTLHAPWVHSLKEKRSEVKSLTSKLRGRFNVSVAETGTQDVHQTITLGIAAIAGDAAQMDRTAESLLRFVEESTDAGLSHIDRQVF